MPSRVSSPNVDELIAALPGLLVELAHLGVARSFRKGSVLITEGDRGETLYIILSGRLRVYSSSLAGDKEVTHGTYGAGEYVGELSLDGGPRAASVEAAEPSLCVLITRPTLEAFIARNPSFAFDLLSKVIGRARAATISATSLALNDVYGRLKQHFESLSSTPDAVGWVELKNGTSHSSLASSAGCSRAMVSRVMKDLVTAGHADEVQGRVRVRLPLPPRW